MYFGIMQLHAYWLTNILYAYSKTNSPIRSTQHIGNVKHVLGQEQ